MDDGKLDRLDYQIIRHLRLDGRRATKDIASDLGVTEPTVASRIRALSEAGAMRVMAQKNVALLRNRLLVFIDVWVRDRPIDEVADSLGQVRNVATVHVCVGSPEIIIIAFVEDASQGLILLQTELGEVAGVERLEINLALEMRTYRSDYAVLNVGATIEGAMDDPLDDKIVRQLQIDGRVSNREIARVLDVPASTIRERVNRLLSSRAIRIGAICDPYQLGLTSSGFGHLQIAAARLDEALEYLEGVDDIGICSSITGRSNVFVLFAARDFHRFVEVVKSKLEATPGLKEITVRMIAETRKHRADLISIVPPRPGRQGS